jgi:DNA-binding response OmpR family regulator
MPTGKHIVVVDDDIYLSDMISQILTIEGYSVTMLQDGEVLLKNLDEYKPDLILLDIKMPVISGYDVLKAIRLKSRVPVIMLTGVMETESISACIEMGADDYIKKPFYPHELVARVRAKLRRSALQSTSIDSA